MNPTPKEVQAVLQDMRQKGAEYVEAKTTTAPPDGTPSESFGFDAWANRTPVAKSSAAEHRLGLEFVVVTKALKMEAVHVVRKLHDKGDVSFYEMGKKYDVAPGTVYDWYHGKTLPRANSVIDILNTKLRFAKLKQQHEPVIEVNAQPRTRKPRKSRGFNADLITLFDMERDRQGLTNSEYLAALMGVSST